MSFLIQIMSSNLLPFSVKLSSEKKGGSHEGTEQHSCHFWPVISAQSIVSKSNVVGKKPITNVPLLS